jgi:dolichyl-diphosphooligosaccharide--protein glycosyltransferase
MNKYQNLVLDDSNIRNSRSLLFILFLLSLSVIINVYARIHEKNVWLENPSVFSVEDTPLVRTGDPALYIKIAQYVKKNVSVDTFNDKIDYPIITKKDNRTTLMKWMPTIVGINKDIDTPLISLIVSYLAKGSSLKEIINAGNFLIFIASAITTIGIFFMFFIIGRPFEGIVASLGAGISSHYLPRSSVGYVDTDILNLFFIYLLFTFVYLASKKQSWYKNIIFIVIAGLVGKVFFLWYPKPPLILLGLFSLAFFTTFHTKDWKRVIFNCGMYIILTNIHIIFEIVNTFNSSPYLAGYLSANVEITDLVNKTQLNFNDIYRFIGEQKEVPFFQLLMLEGSIFFGITCFMGIVLWGIANPIKFIGFSPLILFFLLSAILGTRALFYSQPFMWFGLAYIVNFITIKFTTYKKFLLSKFIIYSTITACLFITIILIQNPFTKQISSTYIPQPVTTALIKIKDLVPNPKQSVMVSQWSYGYQSILYNDFPVLIHNGMPTSPRHYFIERAFTSNDLNETSKILNYVANGNIEKINEKNIDSFVALSKDLYATPPSDDDIYILVSQQQRKFMAFSGEIAYWDVEKNKPFLFNEMTASSYFTIMEINCEDLDTSTFTTKCAETEGSTEYTIPVNLALGTWNNEPVLKRVVQIADGNIEINEEYADSQGHLVFQIVKNLEDNTSNLYLMHEAAFNSTYNKLLHLNLSENYELVYDDYPNVKIYKVN